MRTFIAAALGGTHVDEGRDMATSTPASGITAREFDRVASHLAGALRSLGVPTEQDRRPLLAPDRPAADEVRC